MMRDGNTMHGRSSIRWIHICWRLAIAAGFVIALSGAALAQKDDITWEEFNPPDSGKAPMMGRPVIGAPDWRPGCKPAGDGAWYRLCQCPGSTGTTCTISYYSLAPYSCPEPPSPIYLVSAIGRSKETCGKKGFERTKAAWKTLGITWEPHDYRLDDSKDSENVGQLEKPGDKKPDDKTPLKKEEKAEKKENEKKDTEKGDKKDSAKTEKKDNLL
jgi:hypothetical protein